MTAIYLDHAATTPVDPRVYASMLPFLSEHFGNPHSDHVHALEPWRAVENAVGRVASLLGADVGEIVFTSGATEANNAAIKGVMLSPQRRGNHIVVSAIEHKCVLAAVASLIERGCTVSVVAPTPSGTVEASSVIEAIREDTALVSVMAMNNEIGTEQPIGEIARACRAQGVVVHTDAAQLVGRAPVDVYELGVDLLSLSGHKLHGPKGIGALYVSSDCPVRLEPLIHGGGQQGGRRGGTLPTFLCVGLGEAAAIALYEGEDRARQAAQAAHTFIGELRRLVPAFLTTINLDAIPYPWCLSLRFPGAEAATVLQLLHGRVSASLGSACLAGAITPSHVLTALGLSVQEANETIRFSLGATVTSVEAREAAEAIARAVERARVL